jgi:hypothetical protein
MLCSRLSFALCRAVLRSRWYQGGINQRLEFWRCRSRYISSSGPVSFSAMLVRNLQLYNFCSNELARSSAYAGSL